MLSVIKEKVNICQKQTDKNNPTKKDDSIPTASLMWGRKLMLNLESANECPDICVSSLNYKHTAYLGGLWSPSKPSCWEMWISFSFWRSQSRYPISRGWKSKNIWSSSKWKHLHCHLFSSPLLSCWMWITQPPPNMSVIAVCNWRAQSCKNDAQTCCSGN